MAAAAERCENESTGGFDDCRLPSAKELLTLIRNDQQFAPGISFGATDEYWTSSPSYAGDSAYAITFPSGEIGTDTTGVPHSVRCVRGPAP